jgi:hypothetical protein
VARAQAHRRHHPTAQPRQTGLSGLVRPEQQATKEGTKEAAPMQVDGRLRLRQRAPARPCFQAVQAIRRPAGTSCDDTWRSERCGLPHQSRCQERHTASSKRGTQ